MPRIPTIFDNALIDTFELLFKTAQAVDANTPDFAELANKLLDGLLTEVNNGQAPTAASFESPDALIEYLRTNNVKDSQGQRIVFDREATGYVPYKAETYINVDGLKTLLNQYKEAASQQKNIQGQYFIQAIDSLVTKLQATQGFQNIGTPEPKTMSPAAKTPEGQAAGASKPEAPGTTKPEAAQQANQTPQQAQMTEIVEQFHPPLPPDGQGVFNVDMIASSMEGLLRDVMGGTLARELSYVSTTLLGYVKQAQSYAMTFKQLSPGGEPQFMVGDFSQTYQGLRVMFNPGGAPGGMEHADGGHYGSAAAMQALQQCQYIVRLVGLFFATLGRTSMAGVAGNLITQQTRSANILMALFGQVIDQFSRDKRQGEQVPGQRMQSGWSGGNY